MGKSWRTWHNAIKMRQLRYNNNQSVARVLPRSPLFVVLTALFAFYLAFCAVAVNLHHVRHAAETPFAVAIETSDAGCPLCHYEDQLQTPAVTVEWPPHIATVVAFYAKPPAPSESAIYVYAVSFALSRPPPVA